jgi:hypothetical protein
MAQGVTVGFIVHIRFIYGCSATCPFAALYPFYPWLSGGYGLSNMQVTLNDQTGRIVATGMSADGSEILVPVRTETPIYSLTARAYGYASAGQYSFWTVNGISTIIVQTVGLYEPDYVNHYWITIRMQPTS